MDSNITSFAGAVRLGDRWIVKTDVRQGFTSHAGNPPEGGGFPALMQVWRDLFPTPFVRIRYPGCSFLGRSTNRVPDIAVVVQVKARVKPGIAPAQPELCGELQIVGKAHGPVAVEVGGKGLQCGT